jgi:hypothetical protein
MLTFFGAQQRYCDGISRRNFLRIGAFGAGLTLADMLRSRAQASSLGNTSKAASSNKAAIMIYLPGGPSHMDMWDLKPDAPAEFRGEFKPINTNVPGVQISEHFPLQARMWDKMSVIRSVKSVDEHSDSYVSTGYSENSNRIQQHPSFGSVVSRTRMHSGNDIPPFVSLRGMSIGTEPGYLGIAHRPFTPDGPGLRNLQLASGVTTDRLDDRKALLSSLDSIRRDVDASGTMNGMDSFNTRAFDMVASGAVRKALDLSKEDPRARDRYKGLDQFLTARRLVEAGVGCVTLAYGGWDTHSANFKTLKNQLPRLDVALASLVQDLHDRGMDQDVTVLCWGEFGRTPKINNTDAGRDHWGPVMSCFIAGGPFKMGQAIGTTSERGEYAKDRPYKPSNILSTVYTAMGIDPAQTFNNGSGRPMYVLDERDPVTELL